MNQILACPTTAFFESSARKHDSYIIIIVFTGPQIGNPWNIDIFSSLFANFVVLWWQFPTCHIHNDHKMMVNCEIYSYYMIKTILYIFSCETQGNWICGIGSYAASHDKVPFNIREISSLQRWAIINFTSRYHQCDRTYCNYSLSSINFRMNTCPNMYRNMKSK